MIRSALAGVLLLFLFSSTAHAYKISEAGNPVIALLVNKTIVQAEVVASTEKLILGLGGRRKLAPGSGMLFIMPDLEVQEFCMNGMLIPIDIIWICQNRIIGFEQNRSPKDTGTFLSPAPADVVLEVPAGFVRSAGLRVGDRVEHLD